MHEALEAGLAGCARCVREGLECIVRKSKGTQEAYAAQTAAAAALGILVVNLGESCADTLGTWQCMRGEDCGCGNSAPAPLKNARGIWVIKRESNGKIEPAAFGRCEAFHANNA